MEFIIHILIIIMEAFGKQNISIRVASMKMLIRHSYSPFVVIIIIVIMDIIIIKEYNYLNSFVEGYLRIIKPIKVMAFMTDLQIIIMIEAISIIKVIIKFIRKILIDFILDLL